MPPSLRVLALGLDGKTMPIIRASTLSFGGHAKLVEALPGLFHGEVRFAHPTTISADGI